MIREIVFGAMLSVALLAGCKSDPDCGALEYDRVTRRCICRGTFTCDTPDTCVCVLSDGGQPDPSVPDGGSTPSAPQISIAPQPARTDDDLVATIDVPSIDPMGAAVTYEYAWSRDGSVLDDVSGNRVPAGSTTRGETWSVSVTAVAEDGRRGGPGTASITIANTPPVLATVGLDQYRPVVGERIRAVPGTLVDADLDVAGVRYQWYRGTAAIPDASGVVLDLSGMSPGDEVSLEAWATDDTDPGARVRVGPVRVLSAENRWRAILPAAPTLANTGTPGIAHDHAHERIVRWIDGRIWEFVDRDGDLIGAELAARGPRPRAAHYQLVLHDTGNRRLLVVDADDPSLLHALDLSRRGREEWTTLSTSGPAPSGGTPYYSVWSEGDRIWLLGRDSTASDPRMHLFSLRVSPVGAEAWTEHSLGPGAPQLTGAAIVAHPTMAGRSLLFGGADLATSMPNRNVYALDVFGVAAELSVVGSLPSDRFGAGAVSVDSDLIWVVGGTDAFTSGSAEQDVLAFELSSSSVEVAGRVDAGAVLFAVADREGVTLGRMQSEVLELDRLERGAAVATRLAAGQRPISPTALAAHDASAVVLDAAEGRWLAWHFDFATDRWGVASAADAGGPAPRFGVQSSGIRRGASYATSPLWGGRDAVTRDLAPVDAIWTFDVNGSDATWSRYAISGAGPTARASTTVVQAECSGFPTYVMAGGSTFPTQYDDAWILTCAPTCTWAPATGAVARSRAAFAATSSGHVLMFGGTLADEATEELWALEACGSGGWSRVSPTGIAAGGRAGHALVRTGVTGGYDTFLTVGGEVEPWQPARLIIGSSTARWEAVPLASDSERPDRVGSLVAWHPVDSRLVVLSGEGGWELLIR